MPNKMSERPQTSELLFQSIFKEELINVILNTNVTTLQLRFEEMWLCWLENNFQTLLSLYPWTIITIVLVSLSNVSFSKFSVLVYEASSFSFPLLLPFDEDPKGSALSLPVLS